MNARTEESAAVEPLGDSAVRWLRDPEGDPRALLDALRAHSGVVDAIVTELHACVTFDPLHPPDAPWVVEANLPRAGAPRAPPREHVIRARYDGPDLAEVASRLAVTREHVIHAHSSRLYVARMIGFLPGFAYLAATDPPLPLPRRAVPRTRVEPLSIGIAAGYTAVYPFASPGGWNLIARAVDFVPFDRELGARIALGDHVRFAVLR
jgi:UPF0271 protein